MIRIGMFDADAVAEALARLVHLDGMAERCPLATLDLLGIEAEHVPPSKNEDGFFVAKPLVRVGINWIGPTTKLRTRASHELGHVGLWVCGYRLPHNEEHASRVGRAYCMGRADMIRRLTLYDLDQVVDSYDAFEPGEVLQRIYEVRRTLVRRAV